MRSYDKDSNEKILRLRQELHEQEEWERYEWKCIGCEKSLTHIHFDNDALMPYLEDPFSDHPSSPSIPSHALLSEGDSIPTAQDLQDTECHQLLCNQCKYDIDDNPFKETQWNRQPQSLIRSSRYIKYGSLLYRYFPGLADMSGRKEFTDFDPPRHWPTYMVRCTDCKKWKEIRHYLNDTWPDHLPGDFLPSGCIVLKDYPFLRGFTTCDQCIDVQEANLSPYLVLLVVWIQKNSLEAWDFNKWPEIFGHRTFVDTEKSCAYVWSVREEFERSGGERGLNKERFREEGYKNFTFEIKPDGQREYLNEEDIQKVETCLDYYIWLLRAEKILERM
jgi:hypothetical protein